MERTRKLASHLTRGALILLAAVARALAADAPAPPADENPCLSCHAPKEALADLAELPKSAHEGLLCADCHVKAAPMPHEAALPPVDCGGCHDVPAAQLAKSIHASRTMTARADAPTCIKCHGRHAIYPVSDLRSPVGRLRVDATCLGCHGDAQVTERHMRLPSAEFVKGYVASVHGRGVHEKGLVVSATCSDCHDHHAILPTADPAARTHRDNIPETCARCHLGIYEDFASSTHGKIWKAGRQDGPVCTDCHQSHRIEPPKGASFRLSVVKECGGCHDAKADSFSDTFHGKATSLGFVVAARCSDCHTAHRNLPASDPASTVHPSRLEETCKRCHAGATARFVGYQPHLDHGDSGGSAVVHGVAWFMEWLLLGTFSMWGLHTALWLQRAIVAIRRREHAPEAAETRWVRRFRPGTIKIHVVIVTSFLVLVATGLPLKYHDMAWAQALEGLWGGVEVARYFHRVMAVLTFGYAFTHIGWLLREVLLRGRRDIVLGNGSLMPSPKDLIDLRDNVRWFLYQGPPPRYGRFTYFEKFDYFAVFWGVPVIGLSGLLMWFPTFFTHLLPGIALNVAAVVHGEEALLAFGFIFTFHFFHNHMRPENFPLDTSVFTGRIPLARFKLERPDEYEQAVKGGTLESMIVSPPDPAIVWRARVFGFASLGVGLALVLAVFLTYVAGRL